MTRPSILTIGIKAVQLIIRVLCPVIATSPKFTGLVQLSGRFTGDPNKSVRLNGTMIYWDTYRGIEYDRWKSRDTIFHYQMRDVGIWTRRVLGEG